ncbi:MAG: peptide deformylase [Litorilinea sp.]
MAVLKIVNAGEAGDEVLYRPAARVRDFGPALHQLLDDMLETLREAPGVGLAAPQVGIGQRVLVIEYPDDEEDPENTMRVYEVINPEILRQKGEETAQEGCLSLPSLAADVPRATYALVRAQDRNGNEVRYKAYDWLARIFQHEIDHVHGVLMTDRAEQVFRLERDEDGELELVPIDIPTRGTNTRQIAS